MEENFSMEWKIFGMEWKWNGNGMEENYQYEIWKNRLPFHTMPRREASHAKLTQGAAFKRNGTSLTRCWR